MAAIKKFPIILFIMFFFAICISMLPSKIDTVELIKETLDSPLSELISIDKNTYHKALSELITYSLLIVASIVTLSICLIDTRKRYIMDTIIIFIAIYSLGFLIANVFTYLVYNNITNYEIGAKEVVPLICYSLSLLSCLLALSLPRKSQFNFKYLFFYISILFIFGLSIFMLTNTETQITTEIKVLATCFYSAITMALLVPPSLESK